MQHLMRSYFEVNLVVFGLVAAVVVAVVVVEVVFVALVALPEEHWMQPLQRQQQNVDKQTFELELELVGREIEWVVGEVFLVVTWLVDSLFVEDAFDFDLPVVVVGSNSKVIENYCVGPVAVVTVVVVVIEGKLLDH